MPQQTCGPASVWSSKHQNPSCGHISASRQSQRQGPWMARTAQLPPAINEPCCCRCVRCWSQIPPVAQLTAVIWQ